MSLLHTVVAFIVALGVLIIVHEYGHYLVARLCGVKVLRFSVGFGRPLLSWKRGPDATEWAIAAVPFGGYVKMLDEREGPVAPEEAPRAFNRQGVAKRFLIVVAGPVFNFLFAIAVYAGLFMYGVPEARPVLGEPPAGTLAAGAGLHSGDTVRSTNGEPLATWQDLRWRVLQAALQGQRMRLEATDKKGNLREATLDLSGFSEGDVEGDVLERVGLRLYRAPLAPVLGKLVAGGAGERAGLKEGDRILSAGGKALDTWEALVNVVRANPKTPLHLEVERGGKAIPIEVVPDAVTSADVPIGRIGAAPFVPPGQVDRIVIRIQYGLLDSLAKGACKTVDISVFSLKMLGKMLVGQVSWRHLSGPVTIADFAGQSAQL